MCDRAVNLSEKYLYEAHKAYIGDEQQYQRNKNERGNFRNLAAFLCKPNVTYPITERVESKKADAMTDAGKRIVGSIAYSWDYYFRMLKGKFEVAGVAGK